MKIQLLNITPDLQPFSKELENTATPTSQHWVVTDSETTRKVKYIFRPNGNLVVFQIRDGQANK
jgi:hypothetical protein